MIDVAFDEETRTIAIRATGTVSVAELDAAAAKLAEAVGSDADVRLRGGKSYRLLSDWSGLESLEKGALAEATLFGLGARDVVRRVAIVAGEKWRDEEARISDVYNQATVRLFPPERRAEAEAWLKEE